MTAVVAPARRGPGFVDSGDQEITGVLGAPGQTDTLYVMTALLNPGDVTDPTLVLTDLTIYLDGQAVWGPGRWVGNTTDRNGNPVPFSTFYGDGRVHQTVRVTATLPKRMSFGLDVSGGSVIQ